MAPDTETTAMAGSLSDFSEGHLGGAIVPDARLAARGTATVEVFAHGIPVASGPVPLPGAAPGASVPFRIPVHQFAQVGLPVTLSARIAETDAVLDSSVTVTDLDQLWQAMMPFRPVIDRVEQGEIVLRVPGEVSQPDAEIFELREGGASIGVSAPRETDPSGHTLFAIPLPQALLDGAVHSLVVVHRGTNLPVTTQPLQVTLSVETVPRATIAALTDRVDGLERQIRERYADAFNGLALKLYEHIDRVALNQRSNFEREIAAMRKLLDLPDTAAGQAIPAQRFAVTLDAELTGYGLYPASVTATGKPYRFVAPRCGFMLPPLAPGDVNLVIQGIKRSHDGVLDGAGLHVNGMPCTISPYVNPRSESWNITTQIPAALMRPDRNLLELRLPNGLTPEAAQKGDERAVGIMELRLETVPDTAPAA